MTIYVDQLQQYPGAKPPFQMASCHLMVGKDDDLEDLHKFAEKIGLQRKWFQDKASYRGNLPHYDLVASMRKLAVENGAEEVDFAVLLERCTRKAR